MSWNVNARCPFSAALPCHSARWWTNRRAFRGCRAQGNIEAGLARTDRTDALPTPCFDRRVALSSAVLFSAASLLNPLVATAAEPVITQKVFFDVGICPEALNRERKIGDKSALCPAPESQGRLVLGLYGQMAPQTVSNFVKLVDAGVYTGTTFHKVLPGQYVQAGKQGAARFGRVDSRLLQDIPDTNSDFVSSTAFSLSHARPGTVSLCIAENDDDADQKMAIGYKNTQFLITTGPGPAPSLDGENLVFGRVLEGFGTLSSIVAVPTIRPNEQLARMNALASFIGDERAAKARQRWGSPLKAVIITNAGVLSA